MLRGAGSHTEGDDMAEGIIAQYGATYEGEVDEQGNPVVTGNGEVTDPGTVGKYTGGGTDFYSGDNWMPDQQYDAGQAMDANIPKESSSNLAEQAKALFKTKQGEPSIGAYGLKLFGDVIAAAALAARSKKKKQSYGGSGGVSANPQGTMYGPGYGIIGMNTGGGK
jgi:hypothetical protein